MDGNTYTYLVRSQENPEKSATFTLQNGSVSVELSNTMLQQIEGMADSYQAEDKMSASDLAKPLATGIAQKMLRPIPLNDFSADLDDHSLQTTAWLRTRGLRLAPVALTWQEVDNPDAAQAFVKEVNRRKESATTEHTYPSLFDYWAFWVVLGVSLVGASIGLARLLKKVLDDAPASA